MKCIIQFKGELTGTHDNVIHWKDFMEMGKFASKSGKQLEIHFSNSTSLIRIRLIEVSG